MSSSDVSALASAYGLFAALLGFAIFRHLRALRVPSTNRKAVFGLVSVESAVLILLGLASVRPAWLTIPVYTALGFAAAVLLVLGLVLGAWGLVELRAQKARGFRAHVHAAGALTASVLILGMFGMGFVQGFSARMRRTGKARVTQTRGDEFLRDEARRFTFLQPGTPWQKLDMRAANSDALLSFALPPRQLYFHLAVHDRVQGLDSEEQLAAAILENTKDQMTSVEVQEQKVSRVHELEGLRLTLRARGKGQDALIIHWLHAHGARLYQLTTFGRAGQTDVEPEAEQLFARFQVLEGEAPPPPPPEPSVTAAEVNLLHESAVYGYSVKLDGRVWHRLHADSQRVPLEDFGAGTEHVRLVVSPVWLAGQTPSPEALAQAMLETLGIDARDKALVETGPVTQGPLTGRAWKYERVHQDVAYDYRLRLLQSPDFAWLVAAWWRTQDDDGPALANAALAAVSFSPTPPPVPVGKAPEGRRHGVVFNALGQSAVAARDYPAAVGWFQRAFEADENSAVSLRNTLDALAWAGRSAEGLALLAAQAPRFPNNPRLEACRARLLIQGGQVEEGLRLYGTLLPDTLTDESHLTDYVALLEKQGRIDLAVYVLFKYRARADSAGVTRSYAHLLNLQRKHDQAAEVLSLRLQQAYDPGLAEALLETWLAARQPKKALQAIEAVERGRAPSAELLVLHAQAELALKRTREAKASLAWALELDPSHEPARQWLERVAPARGARKRRVGP